MFEVLSISTMCRSDVSLISFWDVVSKGKKTGSNNNLPEVAREPVLPSPSTPSRPKEATAVASRAAPPLTMDTCRSHCLTKSQSSSSSFE